MPAAEHTISTTRITLPEKIVPGFERADYHRVRPEDPHWPLVAMLVLTQLSAGAFLYLCAVGAARPATRALAALVGRLSVAGRIHPASRPARSMPGARCNMWRRSWLSREVLLFSLFAAAAAASAAIPALSRRAALLGFAGVTASAFIYLVPARPAWNSKSTLADFYLTGLLLGPLFLALMGIGVPAAAVARGRRGAVAQSTGEAARAGRLGRV